MGKPDGSEILFSEARGPKADAESLGVTVAQALLDQGAERILQAVYG